MDPARDSRRAPPAAHPVASHRTATGGARVAFELSCETDADAALAIWIAYRSEAAAKSAMRPEESAVPQQDQHCDVQLLSCCDRSASSRVQKHERALCVRFAGAVRAFRGAQRFHSRAQRPLCVRTAGGFGRTARFFGRTAALFGRTAAFVRAHCGRTRAHSGG